MIDNSIVEKAKNGDIYAFEVIFNKTNRGIYNFLLNLSSNKELADDLTQETYIRAFKSIKALKSKDSIISWLNRIALNLYRDEIKKSKINIKSINYDNEDNDINDKIIDWTKNPENILTDNELQKVVKNAIQSLPEIHREVVVMHHIEGMEISDIAKVLKTSNGTVMSRLARARDALRRKLAFYEGKK